MAEAAVVGVPDRVNGERAVVFVTACGPESPTLANITTHLASIGMAKPKPEELQVVDASPRTASGKVQKYLLRNHVRL